MFLHLLPFLSLLLIISHAQAETGPEELSGFGEIYGAYGVSSSVPIQETSVEPQIDALLPFLQQDERRELLEEKPYTGIFTLLNRRTDRKSQFKLSPSQNIHHIDGSALYVKIHQCVKNVDGQSGNDVSFVEVRESTGEGAEAIVLFNGWVYSQFPSVNQFEHAVYNIKLTDCLTEDVFYDEAMSLDVSSSEIVTPLELR